MTTIRKIAMLSVCIALAFNTALTQAADTFTVVIDAGHGGKDPGAVSGKSQEKTINLNVALKLGELIKSNCTDVKVIYTRQTDVFVELYRRAEIANKANADLFISIHTNAAKSTAAQGAETYLLGAEENRTSANLSVAMEENRAILLESDYETHYEGYDPNSPESQIIFEFMQNEYQKESLDMATLVQEQLTGYARRPDHGVHQAGYLVLWKSAMPSILVELGYISNQTDRNYLVSSKGVDEMSKAIYLAFDKYLSSRRKLAMTNSTAASPAAASSGKQTESQTVSGSPVTFSVQILTSPTVLKKNDSRIKGLKNVSYYRDGKLYKYTASPTSDYEEAKKELKKLRATFKDAFIIAMKDGSRIDLQQAIRESGK